MGDSIDPSSGAAQSAPDTKSDDTRSNDRRSDDRQSDDRQSDNRQSDNSLSDDTLSDTDTDSRPGLFARLRVGLFGPNSGSVSFDDDNDETSTSPRTVHGSVGLANLRRMRVEDVAVPRAEIVAVASDIQLPELVEVFQESGLTRLPVYTRTLDQPIGLIHLKDLALSYGFNGKPARFILKGNIRPLLFVPPSMPLGVLLQKMQNDRMHMALVIDEYGGVDGLVTIEDLLEQVVGEIADEHDEPEDILWAIEKPGCWLVQARAPLDELGEELGLNLTEGSDDLDLEEIDTLGGLIFVMLGRVPTRGEVIPHVSGAQFEIVDADSRRVKRIRIRLSGHIPTAAAAE